MRTLCLDLGNTRKKYAVFEESKLLKTDAINGDLKERIISLLDEYRPEKSILSSVIHHNEEIEPILANASRFHKLTSKSTLNFRSVVPRPETVGADRLAICAAAVNLFPGTNVLAVGLGTCITYNFVNKFGEFLGGGISPGLNMRFRSM